MIDLYVLIIIGVLVYLSLILMTYKQKMKQVDESNLMVKEGVLVKSVFNNRICCQQIELEKNDKIYKFDLEINHYISSVDIPWAKYIGAKIQLKYKATDESKEIKEVQEILTESGEKIIRFSIINKYKVEQYGKLFGGLVFIHVLIFLFFMSWIYNKCF